MKSLHSNDKCARAFLEFGVNCNCLSAAMMPLLTFRFVEAQLREFFQYFDTDGSGWMDFEEFCVMLLRHVRRLANEFAIVGFAA